MEQIIFDKDVTSSFRTKARFIAELEWIKKLQTPFPLGLNDNIYQKGNISKDPKIDIFSIYSIRKRKTRSHGKRRNGNIKRKNRQKSSIQDLHHIHIQSGKHALLSFVSSLPITTLRDIDEQADKIVLRTDPLIKTATLVQTYTKHVLRPRIDKESSYKRHFLKIKFINKGIDFIDLQSIFRDKNVTGAVPNYFKNSEPPIICYKYNNPIRNIIFNYNNVVKDLDIEDNTPSSCTCSSSKFCYSPAGHIVTGNFEVIEDKRLRNLLKKGPKYRIPSNIDFNACRSHIAESLDDFCIKWSRREQAEIDSLSEWKKQIALIIEKRIKFYESNVHLLPQKPNLTARYLRNSISKFHSKFVLAPADKASNNVIII